MLEKQPTLIVGIGASAGGLKPIEEFFSLMPPDSGMAFVIVQHLSPDFKSLMDELLSRHTGMLIHPVTHGMEPVPNNIYLIPPKNDLTVVDGKLMLQEQQSRGLNLPIDRFFNSLAEQVGTRAVAIILSGSGSDGSRGIQAVQRAGGLVLVQTPNTAGFDGMPRAAILSDSVDLVCDVKEMPEHVIGYSQHLDAKLLESVGDHVTDGSIFSKLCSFFKNKTGIEFSYYKRGTIRRRLARRMELISVSNPDEYLARLETDEDEANTLFRELLVEVTHFFRDPLAFKLLREKVIPELIEESREDEEFRAWVCGCATGEEAYSIAMIIHDCMTKTDEPGKPFKVFGTDIHPSSIQIAGEGTYSEAALKHLPDGYLDRYFVPTNNGFKVKQEIRQRGYLCGQ